ncbi:MAG: insulinase family protein [Desulfotignum sp.]|nr:insulinase family protein [Desulfotignum sp.]
MNSETKARLKSIPSLSIRKGVLKKQLYLILLVVIWVGFFSCVPRHPSPFSCKTVLKDPQLVHGILPNGFQYVLMKNSTPEDRVSVHLNISAGSVHETDQEQGVAHFLEHMLFNGTEHFKPGELVTYFQSIGMDFGADANASTSFFHTVYDLSLPKGDKTHLDDALVVIQDYAKGALLLENEIDRERSIILAEKQERDSVSYRSFKRSFAFELPGSILTKRLPIGKESVIETADRKKLKQFYDRWYRPDNMVLIMVGDIDIQVAKKLIQKRFQSLQPRLTQPLPEPVDVRWPPHDSIKPFYHHEPEAGNTQVAIERIEYTDFAAQTPDLLKQTVTRSLADTILQNRLSNMIRQQRADFSSASVYSGTFLRHLSMAAITADCNPEDWENTLAQLEKTLRQALESGFTQKELDRVKADAVSQLSAGVRQAGTRKTPHLARTVLGSVQDRKLFLSPQQKKELLAPYIENLSIEQVNQVFKDVWKPDHRLILVTGNAQIPSDAGASSEDKILQVFKESSRRPAGLFQSTVSKDFPYLQIPDTPAKIGHHKKNVRNLGINVVELDNHIRLNLKQTDFKKGRFLFKVVFGPGRACEPEDKPGISHISQQTVRKSGLSAMNPDQLEEALAGRDVSIEFSVEDTYFSLSGSADPQEIELVFQLIYAFLSDPGFRPESLALAKTQYRQMYDALKQTPEGIMRIKGERFLAGGNPWFGMAHPDEADQITLTDIRSWLTPYFTTRGVEISMVGDFDPDVAVSQALVHLGGGAPTKKAVLCTDVQAPVLFPGGKSLDVTLDTKIDKGMVRLAFLTDDYWDIQQTRALSILSRVVSERLRKVIREKIGAAYSPYAFNQPYMVHDGYGVMQIVVPVSRKNSDMVVQTLQKIISDIVAEGISPQEVTLALNPVIKQLHVLRQSNTYWLNSVLADSKKHPERFAWADTIVSGYSSITHEDLTALAGKYLKLTESALIRIMPGN